MEHSELYWRLDAGDLTWLIDDLRSDRDDDERRFRVDVLFRLWLRGGQQPATLDQIEDAVADRPGLRDELSRLLQPPSDEAAAEDQALRQRLEANRLEREQRRIDALAQHRRDLLPRLSAGDLHRIVLRRLRDLAHDLQHGDVTDRYLFRPETDEEAVQNWLAGRLRDRARGRYTVHREEQVADRKRPDLRLYAPGVAAPACIEIKIAGRWSGNELLTILDDQVVGQYLRDRHSRHVILLLVDTGGQKHWQIPDGRLDFPGLVTRLQNQAAALAARHPDVDSLDVVGLVVR